MKIRSTVAAEGVCGGVCDGVCLRVCLGIGGVRRSQFSRVCEGFEGEREGERGIERERESECVCV